MEMIRLMQQSYDKSRQIQGPAINLEDFICLPNAIKSLKHITTWIIKMKETDVANKLIVYTNRLKRVELCEMVLTKV